MKTVTCPQQLMESIVTAFLLLLSCNKNTYEQFIHNNLPICEAPGGILKNIHLE